MLYHASSHGVLHTAVFLRRDLIWFASLPLESKVTTRPVAQIKTKGALALTFSVFGSSFLFINSHMAANRSSQPDRLKDRIQDYVKIASSLNFSGDSGSNKNNNNNKRSSGGRGGDGTLITKSRSVTSINSFGKLNNNKNNSVTPFMTTQSENDSNQIVGAEEGTLNLECNCDVTEQFEFCVWMGDLNFRLRKSRESVVRMIGDAEDEESREEEEAEEARRQRPGGGDLSTMMELDASAASPLLSSTKRSSGSGEGGRGGSTSNLSSISSSTMSNRDNYDTLFLWDELRNEMTEGTIFRGFQEGKIQFRPSYKYDVGTTKTFDTSTKKRVPAYTDRILYRYMVEVS